MKKIIIDEAQLEQLEQMRLLMFKSVCTSNKPIMLDAKYFNLIDDFFYQAKDPYSQDFIMENY